MMAALSGKLQLAAAAVALGCIAGTTGAVLTMKKVGGFAGEDGSASFEVVAVKPSTNVSSPHRCNRRVVSIEVRATRQREQRAADVRYIQERAGGLFMIYLAFAQVYTRFTEYHQCTWQKRCAGGRRARFLLFSPYAYTDLR